MAVQRLKDAAEKAKKDLSGVLHTQISLTVYHSWCSWSTSFGSNIARAKFDELTHILLNGQWVPTRQALRDAGISAIRN